MKRKFKNIIFSNSPPEFSFEKLFSSSAKSDGKGRRQHQKCRAKDANEKRMAKRSVMIIAGRYKMKALL
jgi:hypothetical protein